MRANYESLQENDSTAISWIQKYIALAKAEKNYGQMLQGYRDAIFYSPSNNHKLIYADSAINAARSSENADLITTAYIEKGVIYYYHYKQYQLALNEYLIAYEYSKKTDSKFLKFQNLYHIGVVKSYLGYYEEAASIFKECIAYYESRIKENIHPNEIYNNKKGYLNSLHQLIVCYRNSGQYTAADWEIQKGLKEVGDNSDFIQEKGYFILCKGISEFQKKNYQSSIAYLKKSLSTLKAAGDFAWLSVNYFYTGKSFLKLHNDQLSILQFKKIDSVFQKHQFILPEVRENYELLINHYKSDGNQERQLYYTNQLLKADSILARDFTYLSSRIHKEYDTKTLLDEKNKLQNANFWSVFIILSLILMSIVLFILLRIKLKKGKDIQKRYLILEDKLLRQQNKSTEKNNKKLSEIIIRGSVEKRIGPDESIVEELLIKLKSFEDKKGFIKRGLTINKLANQLGTNSNYLSHVINEYKGVNFNKYLSDLRINYITVLLFDNKEYLKYGIESLAKECGIASRQNFSDLFYEINGIRPTDFIKKRRQELDKVDFSN
ncbi:MULTISPECIES: helix-turn-helix domain-containing protein [Chryseobacterium]|nr:MULTISPECIES: AraC family transcriptional regulator [Chryseobacterium]